MHWGQRNCKSALLCYIYLGTVCIYIYVFTTGMQLKFFFEQSCCFFNYYEWCIKLTNKTIHN